jgi:hypothetical protein
VQKHRRDRRNFGRHNGEIFVFFSVQVTHIFNVAEAIDNWFENIQHYEQTVEEMATSKLDPKFKDELNRVNEWFRLLCEAERTAALYIIVQQATQVQIRFLIAVLSKMANQDPLGALLSPGPNQDKGKKQKTDI